MWQKTILKMLWFKNNYLNINSELNILNIDSLMNNINTNFDDIFNEKSWNYEKLFFDTKNMTDYNETWKKIPNSTYDVIISHNYWKFNHNTDFIIENMKRTLKTNGIFCFFIIPGEKLYNNLEKEKYVNKLLFLFKNQFFEIKHFSDNSIYSSQKNFEYCIIGSKKEEQNNDLKELKEIIEKQNNKENEEIKKLKLEIKKFKTKLTNQNNQIRELENKTKKQELFIKSTPELSRTSLGRSTSNGKITYRNWWVGHKSEFEGVLDEYWFSQFVNTKFPNENFKLNFFSVWNKHCTITDKMEGKKIFYTAECMKRHQDITKKYGEYALNYVDLGLGFEYLDNPKYLRFPYWITRTVYPHMTEEYIETLFENWNTLDLQKTKNVSAINSHDKWKTRTLIANDINKYTEIEYAGLWNKNTNDLIDKFNNNKIEYLNQFKFNICGENLVDDGYVTEKIFDAIKSDCIPLYIGGGKEIEPEVLNEKAILRWHENKDNSDTLELFKNLLTDEKSYKEFKEQKIFLDSAPKYVINKLNELEKKIGELIYS